MSMRWWFDASNAFHQHTGKCNCALHIRRTHDCVSDSLRFFKYRKKRNATEKRRKKRNDNERSTRCAYILMQACVCVSVHEILFKGHFRRLPMQSCVSHGTNEKEKGREESTTAENQCSCSTRIRVVVFVCVAQCTYILVL